MNRREPSPDSPQRRPSLPIALCLAVTVAALIVFAVPRIAALAHERSKYSQPATEPAGRTPERFP